MNEFKTTSIRFTSRASIKLNDSYFTFESTIEKQCPENFTEEEYQMAKEQLWNEVNSEIDNQIIEVQEFMKSKRK